MGVQGHCRVPRCSCAHELPAQRSASRDPWRQVTEFLTGALADHGLFAELLKPLMTLHDRLASIYAHSTASVPVGFIHNDSTPSNLLIDTAGEVTALLDFDDSAQTYLAYELGAIIGAFGRDRDQRVDPHRAYALVAAYD